MLIFKGYPSGCTIGKASWGSWHLSFIGHLYLVSILIYYCLIKGGDVIILGQLFFIRNQTAIQVSSNPSL